MVQRDSDIRGGSSAGTSTISKRSADNIAVVTDHSSAKPVTKKMEHDIENQPIGRAPDSVSFGLKTAADPTKHRYTGTFGRDPSIGMNNVAQSLENYAKNSSKESVSVTSSLSVGVPPSRNLAPVQECEEERGSTASLSQMAESKDGPKTKG